MPNKHHVIDPNGQRHQRISRDRTYSHAVLTRPSYEGHLAAASDSAWERTDRSNYGYYVRETGDAPKYAPNPEERAKLLDKIAGCATVEDYLAKAQAERTAKVEQLKASGRFEKWSCAGWCGRRDLAEKLAAKERRNIPSYVAEVRIVEAQHG